MNKYLISSIVIITFTAYSVYQRAIGVQTIPVVAPKSISSAPSSPTPILTLTLEPTQSASPNKISTTIPQNTLTPTQKPNSLYKDGTYTGDPADAFYGNIQVQATISDSKLTNIRFLQYPNDRSTSIDINQQADPMLSQEAIQAQSANVDIISGATDSSQAFIQSLQSALDKAKS